MAPSTDKSSAVIGKFNDNDTSGSRVAILLITQIGEVAERLTNSPGANLDSEAGPEGVTYREVGHSAPGIGAYELAVPIKDRLLENGEVAERLNAPVLKTGKG